MKILHVVPSYEPAWAFGGTVTATSQLCKALARKGVDVTVYTTNANGKGGHLSVLLNESVNLDGVKVWYFHCNFGIRRAFYSRGLSKKLRETLKNFDLVHVSAIWQWHQQSVYSLCKNIPFIISPHSSLMKYAFYSVGNQLIKKFYWKFFLQRTIKGANAIHFLCEEEREESKRFLNSVSSFIVPNGIECEKFIYSKEKRLSIRKLLNIPEESIVFLFLGRIHPKKRIEIVLDSISFARKYKQEIFFIIVGYIEDEDYYKSLKQLSKRLGIDSNVIWYGPVDNAEVSMLYSLSDIMVLPSIVEGISMAIIEAMANSLPLLISNRVANYREVLADKAGFIVEPNYESMRKSVMKICLNPSLLRDMAKNAKKSANNRYSIDKVASLMIKAYEDVLTGRRSKELQWK